MACCVRSISAAWRCIRICWRMIRTMPAQSVAIAMRRGAPTVMIAFSLPHPGGDDEDSLQRDADNGNGDDIAAEAICGIIRSLHEEGPSAIKKLRAFTDALGDMCQAYMDRDNRGLEDSAHDAAAALRSFVGED